MTANGPTPSKGTLRVEGDGRPVGWYQIMRPSQAFETFRLTLDWAGDFVGSNVESVARARLFAGPDDPDLIIVDYSRELADVAFQREHTAGRSQDWQPASLCPAPGGNGGVIQRGNGELVVVILELTGFWGGPHRVSWDNIVLTPEPATLALVALGGGSGPASPQAVESWCRDKHVAQAQHVVRAEGPSLEELNSRLSEPAATGRQCLGKRGKRGANETPLDAGRHGGLPDHRLLRPLNHDPDQRQQARKE